VNSDVDQDGDNNGSSVRNQIGDLNTSIVDQDGDLNSCISCTIQEIIMVHKCTKMVM
jgi:hypothetical protein